MDNTSFIPQKKNTDVKTTARRRTLGFQIGGIFFTMYDSRTRLANDVVMQVKTYFKDSVFTTIIPRNVRLSEAPSYGKPICLYDPSCIGARSYEKLAEEVVQRG